MINATLTPATPKSEAISWSEMIFSERAGKVYRISQEYQDCYRFVTLQNGHSLFIQLEDGEIVTVEHAERDVWEKYRFIPTGETINLTFS